MPDDALHPRYSRQVLFPKVGVAGQQRLLQSRVALVGLGALGAALGELFARAGVGDLRLIDRDIVEESNLGRQSLYTAADAGLNLPKALALANHLAAFNPDILIEGVVAHLEARNAQELLQDRDLILDGCDSFETRYLLNDFAVRESKPWIYGACVGARGLTAVIQPGVNPCLRCLFPEPPPPGRAETCDTAGIIPPIATLVASLQGVEALKILTGDWKAVRQSLLSVELWPFRLVELGGPAPRPDPACPACGQHSFPYLEGGRRSRAEICCGRNAVQILPPPAAAPLDLAAVAARLDGQGPLRRGPKLLRFEIEGRALTIFEDGRTLVTGTGDVGLARALYDRYVGS